MDFILQVLGWSVLWLIVLFIPGQNPGSLESITRLSTAHAVIVSGLAIYTIIQHSDPLLAGGCSIAFFLVDSTFMVMNDRKLGKIITPLRKLEYLHHAYGIGFGLVLLFRQAAWLCPTCPVSMYTYCQVNELSTPFYSMYRKSKKALHGAAFALVFFLSRIVFNFATVVPISLKHCTWLASGVLMLPYQALQCYYMFAIIRKALKGKGPPRELSQKKEGNGEVLKSKSMKAL